MIKANELRIGNWVRFINKTLQVAASTIEDCKRANDIDSPYKYDPIPLTPEILEKAGFVKDENANYFYKFRKKGVTICLCHTATEFYIKGNYYVMGFDEALCNFVHQLQNLYFALTGTELEINL